MKCLIVDDDTICRRTLSKMCTNVDFIEIVAECSNATQALQYLQKNPVDLIFLDIHMPNLTGIEFVRSMPQLPQVVFTTSDSDFALEAFEHNVTDYLIKPVSYPRFLKAVHKANSKYDSLQQNPPSPRSPSKADSETLFLKEDGRLTKVNIADIFWVESVGDYANFITQNGTLMAHATLKKIEERLPPEKFHRIHRKYIINLRKIVDIEDHSVLIKDRMLPISRRSKASLMEKLNCI